MPADPATETSETNDETNDNKRATTRARPARAPVTFTPPSSPAAPMSQMPIGPSPSLLREEANQQFLNGKKALAELTAGIPFGQNGGYILIVERVEPMFFTLPGTTRQRKVGGHIKTFDTAVDLDALKAQYGGGKFKFTVMAPTGVGDGKKWHSSTTQDIEGDPIVQDDGSSAAAQMRPQSALTPEIAGLVEKVIDSKDKTLERMETDLRETRKMQFAARDQDGTSMKDMLMLMFNPQAAAQRAEAEATRRENEAKAERLARENELKLQMAREKEEREERERIRKEEALERERVRKEEKEAAELRRREDKDREEQRRKDEKEENERRHRFEMAQLEARQKEAQAFANAQSSQSKENMVFMINSLKEVNSMKETFLMDMVKKKEDPIDTFIKIKGVLDDVAGKDDDETPTWERVADRIESFAPSLLAAVGMANVGKQAIQGATNNKRLPPKKKTTVVVAEVPAPPPAPPAGAVADAEVTTEGAAAAVNENDMKALVFPGEGDSIETIFEMLLRDVDFAMEREYSAAGIIEHVIEKFPPPVAEYIKSVSADELLKIVAEKVPKTWRINSLDGKKKIREMHALLKRGR